MASGVQKRWELRFSLIQGWEIQTRCTGPILAPRLFFSKENPKAERLSQVLAVVLALLKVM